MSVIAIQKGESWLGESPAPHARWVENPGDAAIFPDTGTAAAYASARGVTFVTQSITTATGNKNNGKKTN